MIFNLVCFNNFLPDLNKSKSFANFIELILNSFYISIYFEFVIQESWILLCHKIFNEILNKFEIYCVYNSIFVLVKINKYKQEKFFLILVHINFVLNVFNKLFSFVIRF